MIEPGFGIAIVSESSSSGDIRSYVSWLEIGIVGVGAVLVGNRIAGKAAVDLAGPLAAPKDLSLTDEPGKTQGHRCENACDRMALDGVDQRMVAAQAF